MQNKLRSMAAWPVLLTALAGFVGCTVVAGRSGHQCDADSDCRGFGAGFESSRCSLERVCVNVTLPPRPDGGDGTTCSTNAECVTNLGGPARCVQNACISLVSEDCSLIPGSDYQRDDAIYVGVLAPLSGENVSYGANYVNSAYAAATALNANTLDVNNARPVVVIGCDESVDPIRATNFLVGKVGAIVGPMADTAFETVLPVTKRAGIPLLSPLNDNPKYATTPNADGLAWSCSPNRADATRAWTSAVKLLEERALAAHSATELKLFLAASREPSVQEFAAQLESTLTFNGGKSTAENGAAYARGDYVFDPNTKPDLAAIAGQILGARPMVVLLPSLFGAAAVINAVEDGWGAGVRPLYLVHRIDPRVSRDVVRTEAAERRSRLFGLEWTRPDFARANASQFAGAFSTLNGLPPAFLSEAVFDCTFAYLYGSYASVGRQGGRIETLTGETFRTGITLISTDGENLKNVGSNDARSITDTLLNTALPVRVRGAATDMAFDLNLGAPHAGPELYCIESTTGSWRAAGVTYARDTGTPSGTFSCP